MTAPTKQHIEVICTEPWAIPGWDQVMPCELIHLQHGQEIKCDEPAEIAFKLSCCGYVKHVCGPHWEYLAGPDGIVPHSPLQCFRCKANHTDFHKAVVRSWKL